MSELKHIDHMSKPNIRLRVGRKNREDKNTRKNSKR